MLFRSSFLQIIKKETQKNMPDDNIYKVNDIKINMNRKKESNDITNSIKKFRDRLSIRKLPPLVSTRIEEEIKKFKNIDVKNPEFSMAKKYLDTLTAYPWGISTTDSLDLDKSKEILDNDHYGMDDVKQRILEFIAIGKLKGKVHGKILCFVGPPGVGKTSIGESIARAVNRKFFRVALGGTNDTGILKGFRRTYIGAIPGKIVQGICNIGCENPVILLDEIDKLGTSSVHGDPSSVFLEILDPEQNTNFTDDYLDLPVDLSKVLFLCTANTESTIPKPLLNRMELIQVNGYTHSEKEQIYQRYLLPKAVEKAGLKGKGDKFKILDEAKTRMIIDYCREPGVRGLKKAVKRITEKIAYNIVTEKNEFEINMNNLEDFIGHPSYHSKKIYKTTPAVSF